MTHTYQIRRTATEFTHRNRIEETGLLGLFDAQQELRAIASGWNRAGGNVVRRTKNYVVCAESNDSETYIYTIEKYNELTGRYDAINFPKKYK